MSDTAKIYKVSNPAEAQKKAYKYLGKDAKLYISNNKDKKYYVVHPTTQKKIHFGNINYEDYTKHKDNERRDNYLKRSANIKGKWRSDPYSPNNLSRNILW